MAGNNDGGGNRRNEEFQRKMYTWMMGRYGIDNLTRFMMILACVLVVINFFAGSYIVSTVAMVLMVLAMVRSFSRNIAARRKELAVYETCMIKPRAWWARVQAQRAARKQAGGSGSQTGYAGKKPRTAHAATRKAKKEARKSAASNAGSSSGSSSYAQAGESRSADGFSIVFPCEKCGQSLSVPVGKGKVRVTCPKCGNQMIRRS